MELQSYNSVAVLTFKQEDPYPRLTQQRLESLERLLEEIRHSGLFRGVVIAANAQSFATGADIEEISTLGGFGARQFAERGQRLFNEIARFPAPVVAAIRGHCLGGGLDLALSCHARVAAYDASFGHPGGAIGLMTGWGGTQRLARLLGRSAALQVLLTGERIPATQAMAMGLVDELAPSPDLMECAVRRCDALRRSVHEEQDLIGKHRLAYPL
jgi:enoyl-CoA hydratase/carnithine racemase